MAKLTGYVQLTDFNAIKKGMIPDK